MINEHNNRRLALRLRRRNRHGQMVDIPEINAHELRHHHPHPHAATHAPVGETEEKIARLQEQLVRTQAEFDNYRKRQRRDEQQKMALANQNLLEHLLPVIDNFERALANPGESVEGLLSGLEMVHKQLLDNLRQAGLERIEAQGQPFDPNYHEAVGTVPSQDVPENHVVQVLQEGYKLKDRLLRPAMVQVASKS